MLKVRQPLNTERENFQPLQLVPVLLCLVAIAFALRMTFRIEKATDMHKTIISVSGRLQSEHLDALKMEVDGERLPVALDLEDVTLVDIDVIRFLNACEEIGVELLHCWPYIREWMIRENARERPSQEAVRIWNHP